ncbi:MAG: phosphoglycerate kinase [Bryobacterales bacterium]|nr:phosphoglycerate kinase [Bryobacterales bacterium]
MSAEQTMEFRTLDQLSLSGKRVFIRVDFNVPLDKETGQTIRSDTRIRMALPTVQAVLERGASVVLASHLGRPKGIPNAKMSLAPVAKRLAELLQRPVGLAPDCIGPETASMARALCPGELLLLENLRFHAGEEANDPAFARELALLADVYVNDAFGAAHRAHASTAGVAELLEQHSAGLLMQRELEYLSMATSAPRHPYVAIIGGAKISGKIDVIRNLLTLADKVLIGGAMTYTFLKAKGFGTGASLLEDGRVELASDLLAEAGERLVLPVDHVIADGFSVDAAMQTVIGAVPDGWMGVDIGPETIATYESIIGDAALIVWNGPMGVFELEPFAKGTIAIARAVERASANSISIVGGGDSERAIRVAGVGRNITHISTGGGASLEFLGGQVLPGVAALG